MEINDSSPVINKFQKLKAEIDNVFDITKLKDKGWRKEDIFLNGFQPFHNKLESEISLLNGNPFLSRSLDQWISELEHDIKSNVKTGSKETTEIHQRYRKKLKAELCRIRDVSPVILQPQELPGKVSSKKVKRTEFNQSKLSKSETALLMLYLRDNGAFLTDTPNSLLAECFGKLTGFEGEQLRQTISGKAQQEKTLVTDNNEYYENLITLFNTIIDKIKQDKGNLK